MTNEQPQPVTTVPSFPPSWIDADDLAWLARCERRIWLDQRSVHPPPVTPTADARARMALRAAHKQRILAGIPNLEDLSALDWSERVIQTRWLMQRGAAAIAGAALEAPLADHTLRGAPDLLIRTATTSGAWSYRPVAIVLHTRPTRWDRLLLDAWRWLVGQTQGEAVDPPGELWLGASGDGPALVKRQSASLAPFTAQVWRAAVIATREAPPVWFDNDHCPFCTWRTACDAAARETRDIALLPGLSRQQGIALRQHGIHRIEQVVTLEPGVLATLPDRLPYGGERLRLQAQALLSDQPQPTGTGAPQLPPVGFFLDIESDPLTREPWAFGLAGAPGDRMVVVVDPTSNGRSTTTLNGVPLILAPDVQEGWRRVLAAVQERSGRLAHWGEAERLMLEQSAEPSVHRKLAPLLVDARRELGMRVVLPTPRLSDQRGGGLKAIARWLGCTWSPGADHWTLAWEAYQRWVRQPSPLAAIEMLAPAIVYLVADVEALAAVWRWLEAFVGSISANDGLPDWHACRDTAATLEC